MGNHGDPISYPRLGDILSNRNHARAEFMPKNDLVQRRGDKDWASKILVEICSTDAGAADFDQDIFSQWFRRFVDFLQAYIEFAVPDRSLH